MGGASAEEFERQRGRLFGLAYRMLGSAAEAEDTVQDAFLRWSAADREAIEVPGAWLAKIVTNLCLDRLASARARRERYVGPWLPEPVLTESAALGPMDTAERRELVSLGLLVLMERLTPTERAVFVLREAFGYSHREIAGIVGLSEANSRQLHARARRHLARPESAKPADRAGWRALVDRFLQAASTGDLAGLEKLLAADVTSWADGGGKINAARRPVRGAEKVARYLVNVFGIATGYVVTADYAEVNGAPAIVAEFDGALAGVLVFDVVAGRIATLHILANPDKLAFAAGQLSHPVAQLGL